MQPGGAEDSVRAERRARGGRWQGRKNAYFVGRKWGGFVGSHPV